MKSTLDRPNVDKLAAAAIGAPVMLVAVLGFFRATGRIGEAANREAAPANENGLSHTSLRGHTSLSHEGQFATLTINAETATIHMKVIVKPTTTKVPEKVINASGKRRSMYPIQQETREEKLRRQIQNLGKFLELIPDDTFANQAQAEKEAELRKMPAEKKQELVPWEEESQNLKKKIAALDSLSAETSGESLAVLRECHSKNVRLAKLVEAQIKRSKQRA